MKMEDSWRFDTPGRMPPEAVRAFDTLMDRVIGQGNRWSMLEHFKSYFGGSGRSSSESWAESDLQRIMWGAAENAPLFIEAFYDGCEALRGDGTIAVPDAGRMNRILREHEVGYEIRPPELVAVGLHQPIAIPERYQSLDKQAQEIVQQSLAQAERLLAEGQPRQAVQEILWLMESVVTAFKGSARAMQRSKKSTSTKSSWSYVTKRRATRLSRCSHGSLRCTATCPRRPAVASVTASTSRAAYRSMQTKPGSTAT